MPLMGGLRDILDERLNHRGSRAEAGDLVSKLAEFQPAQFFMVEHLADLADADR
jgi:hypothetical protein